MKEDRKPNYVIGPRAMNDYTANLPESSKKKSDHWWEREPKKVASMEIASPMESNVRPESF
jgi:hypothetical protein